LQSTDAIKSASTLASLSASKSVSEVNSQSKANSVNEVKSLSAERFKSLSEVKSNSIANSISALKSISTVNSLSKSVLDFNAKSASVEKANSLSAEKVLATSHSHSTWEVKSASTVASISAAKSVSTVNSLSKSTSLSELKSLSTEKANSLSASTSVSKAASAASANSASAVKAASASASAYASASAAYSLAIEKQKKLDATAKANPTIENIAAKYDIPLNVVKVAQLMAEKGWSPEDATDYMAARDPNLLFNEKSQNALNNLYPLMDVFKTTDLPANKIPTISELAKHYNVSENAIKGALKWNSPERDAEFNDYMAKHPVDTQREFYHIPELANAMRIKIGNIINTAKAESDEAKRLSDASKAASDAINGLANTSGSTGSTGSSGSTGNTTPSTVVPNTSGGLTSTTPITQPTTQPQTVDAVKQITQAADLANKIVEKTKDAPNPITPKDAKTIAFEVVTYPKEKLKDFTEQTLLDQLGNFAKMVLPGPAYVLDSLGNIVQGQAPMDPLNYARDIYSKDASIDISSLVPDFMKNWANGDTTQKSDIDLNNSLNSGHLLEVGGESLKLGPFKDSNGNFTEPFAVIKVPTTDAVTEKFADVITNNINNPDAIQKYAKDNNLGDTALTKAVNFAKDNANSIKQFNEAVNKAEMNGSLQDGKMIGSELFPTTNAGIDALVEGVVPLKLGIPLVAEIKSLLNGTNYDDALANEYNDYNHWAAANPTTAKLLQTLGVLGASSFTGGLGPYDSIKVSNIWNQDLGINARSIAVNLNDTGPITATPIDSQGNAIGETITLNRDSLPTNFFDTIGSHVADTYNDLIGSIEGTVGSIGAFFTNDQEQLPEDFTGSIYYPLASGNNNFGSTGGSGSDTSFFDKISQGLDDLYGSVSSAFDTYNPLPANVHYDASGALVKNNTFGQYHIPGYDSNGYPLQPGQYPDGTYDSSSDSSLWGSLGGMFDFGSDAGGGSSWYDDLGGMFDFGSWGDSSNQPMMSDLAKGGAVSKEIDRLYKKYGGAV
jgi:hypothetical protein